MSLKTFSDCLHCPIRDICSAHNPAGEWQHDEGKEPCEVIEG